MLFVCLCWELVDIDCCDGVLVLLGVVGRVCVCCVIVVGVLCVGGVRIVLLAVGFGIGNGQWRWLCALLIEQWPPGNCIESKGSCIESSEIQHNAGAFQKILQIT